ncbi:venom allergen 5-like [Diorhabda sublineata]|uniref:venom allergen 5-like n=1 Tax=Diorhabda sublineata TaxID=1163346 RepID=UPI0024E0C1F5|nr:venom allergen 5-like [Diorhabda sublineata]
MTRLIIVLIISIHFAMSKKVTDDQGVDYCSLSCENSAHTVCIRRKARCGPAAHCNSFMEFLNDESRQYILDIHNHLRNQIALGLETRGFQPPASNMNALVYSKHLEYVAQCLTNTCQYAHDVCRITHKYPSVGQNIGVKWFSGKKYDNYKTVINETIYSWYEQVTSFNSSWVENFPDERGIEAYAQLAWANTLEVGCGLTFWSEDGWHIYFFACNYGPAGNIPGVPMYAIGTAATDCSDGMEPNKKFKGLCGQDRINKKESLY